MKILYLCPDLGIPVLGRKGASVHVRELCGAFGRAGHQVVLAAQTLNKSPWEKPAETNATVVHVRPSTSATTAAQALKEFNTTLQLENSLPGELRRILYNSDLETELTRRFDNEPPDFIYERASLYATAGVALAKRFGVPLILEFNAPLAVEQAAYRATGLGELAAQAERWTLTHADAVVVVSSELGKHVKSLGVKPGRIHVMPNGVNPALFHPTERPAVRPLQLCARPVEVASHFKASEARAAQTARRAPSSVLSAGCDRGMAWRYCRSCSRVCKSGIPAPDSSLRATASCEVNWSARSPGVVWKSSSRSRACCCTKTCRM